jgi:hypothetical protein
VSMPTAGRNRPERGSRFESVRTLAVSAPQKSFDAIGERSARRSPTVSSIAFVAQGHCPHPRQAGRRRQGGRTRRRSCAGLRAPRPQRLAVAQRDGAPVDCRRSADSEPLCSMVCRWRRARQVEARRSRLAGGGDEICGVQPSSARWGSRPRRQARYPVCWHDPRS